MITHSFLSSLSRILIITLLLAGITRAQAAPLPITGVAAPTLPVVILEMNQNNSGMGYSVAGAGDVNGDGFADVIVGAPEYDLGHTNEGAAFVFHGSAGGLSTTPAATLQSNQANALLGRSVAGAGDINGDGYDDVIAGAPNYNTGGGAVFVFYGSAGGVSATPAAILESNQAAAYMGYTNGVAGAGDVNGDGFDDIIAGAYLYDNDKSNEGAIFVYHGSTGVLDTTPEIIIEGNESGAHLGESVASAGDVNGDGFDDIIAGMPPYAGKGQVNIYHGSASGLGPDPTTILPGSQSGARLGASVAGAGDVNDDGFADVIAGAPFYTNAQADEGAAFVYHGSADGVGATPAATLEGNLAGAHLGSSVGGAGSLNGDPYAEVIAGANLYTNNTLNEGAAYIFTSSQAGVQTTNPTIMDSNQAGAHLGQSVAGAGDVNGDGYDDIITGAPDYTNGLGDEEGIAFVYYGSAGPNWVFLPAVLAP